MAFRDWLNPQAAIVAISAIDDKDTPHKIPTIATIATIAEVESTKQLAANDQEAQEEADWHEFLYGKSTEELLYNHLLTCNQCEHLALTGTCSRLGKRVNPQAMRECDSFQLLKSERLSIVKVTPYTATELLTHYEKPLFNHLLACPYCHVEKAQYCLNGYAMGSVYDALLLNRDDAQARRESLALQVDRACISGRSVYVPFKPIPF